jgi:hypothetical protein
MLEITGPSTALVTLREINSSMRDNALEWAKRGYPVFPCHCGNKRPLIAGALDEQGNRIERSGGFYRATLDVDTIYTYWGQHPNAMIGIRTGAASGVFVIDLDTHEAAPNGIEAWAKLEAKHEAAPKTLMHSTPSGGVHIFFKWRADKPVGNSEGRLKGQGINIRGEGGYVCAPPSMDDKGRRYSVLQDEEVAEAPGWLYELILAGKVERSDTGVRVEADIPIPNIGHLHQTTLDRHRKYGLAVLHNQCAKLSGMAPETGRNEQLNIAAMLLGRLVKAGALDEAEVMASLFDASTTNLLVKDTGRLAVWRTIKSGYGKGVQEPWVFKEGLGFEEQIAYNAPEVEIGILPPSTLKEWFDRDLPPRDFLLGHWLTSTTRCLLSAETGLGKSNLAIALGMRAAANIGFLHWAPRRACRVLYVDGEMAAELLQERLKAESERIGQAPEGFLALSHEDIEDFRPLNDPRGQSYIEKYLEKVGGVDLIIFDNIMSLLSGSPKDVESWQAVLPWVLRLTARKIGTIWVHHSGHDATRQYGDSSRTWQMDTCIHLDSVKRTDTDISFKLTFKKARQRTPETRDDFQDITVALVDDVWEHDAIVTEVPKAKVKGQAKVALGFLMNAINECGAPPPERFQLPKSVSRVVTIAQWRDECQRRNLAGGEGDAFRKAFDRSADRLQELRLVAMLEGYAWTLFG